MRGTAASGTAGNAGTSATTPNFGSVRCREAPPCDGAGLGCRVDSARRPTSHREAGCLSRRSEQIAAGLCEAILAHRLMPGTKLGQRELADFSRVSRIVIRQALIRLAE